MIDINKLFNDKYKKEDMKKPINLIAFLSLKNAVVSYFSTYKSIKDIADNIFESSTAIFIPNYIEQYYETIIHFQHFFELIMKDILKENNKIDTKELNELGFITALEKIIDLVKKNELKKDKYEFFYKNEKVLRKLNTKRNDLWHRESVFLKYKSFDVIIGKYIFPIVNEIVELPEYKGLDRLWRGTNRKLHSGIEPFNEIILICKSKNPHLDKLAFFKELGRASYNYERGFGELKPDFVKRAENIAKNEVKESPTNENIMLCPVCGVKSLVRYEDVTRDIDCQPYIRDIKCYSCTFELHYKGMRNLKDFYKEYGILDFWLN
ncbi:hypothetical protein [Lysinibacillus sp. BNK-21]|uniref:hypothetical protein n=1 Tax=Lysinibacillus sp. BNK-21 TaxID=3376156 RepID=UPI003B43A676